MPHLYRILDTLWTLAMGLFLGLAAGLVLGVISAFRGTAHMQASPGLPPYADPRFAAHHADAVAGYIGQKLFMVGGSAALALLGIALLAHLGAGLILMTRNDSAIGSKRISRVRTVAMLFVLLCMAKAASMTLDMNAAWPGLYDPAADDATIAARRAAFDAMHKLSEKIVSAAWLAGLAAVALSPWCQRPADRPLQSGDGKETDVEN